MDFCYNLNTNNKNIKLSWEITSEKLCFLDLEIRKDGGKLVTQMYFKPVDRIAIYQWTVATMHPGSQIYQETN